MAKPIGRKALRTVKVICRLPEMKLPLVLVSGVLLLAAFCPAADEKAVALADAVIQASGGENWAKIRRLQFTFNVEQEGKVLNKVVHDWDLEKQIDRVTLNGRTLEAKTDRPPTTDEEKKAYQRWVNDSYWLLAPLKLRDRGTELNLVEENVLELRFHEVGLTPKDVYRFYVDPQTHLVKAWDFMPSPEKKAHGSWEGYKEVGGLKLSTEHQFGGKRIYFTDLAAERRE